MQEWQGGFNFPIFITAMHMTMKLFISIVWSYSPTVGKFDPVSWSTLLLVVLPIGALTAADIVLGNTAILYLPLSLVTTIKGSSLIFTFLWGVILQIERFEWSLLLAVCGITFGLGIAVSNSLDFNITGVILAFASAASGGLRWTLMQFLELRDAQSKSVMVTLYRFAPASALSIIPFVFIYDVNNIKQSHFAHHLKFLYDAILLCAFGGFIAFLLIVAEVKLVRLTSSLTMSVFGQIKEIIQIALAMIIFKENLTIRCSLGIALSICCSCYYRYIVTTKSEYGQQRDEVVDTNTEFMDHDDVGSDDDFNPFSRSSQLKEQELSLLRSKS
jgi:solute carrier family 35 protein C2